MGKVAGWPQSWKLTNYGDILTWNSSDGQASILASLMKGRLTDSDARSFFEGRGFQLMGSNEKTFHDFRCLYQYGNRQSINLLKGIMYFCQVRRGSARDTVVVFYWVESDFEGSYAPAFNKWLDSFRWDGNVKDDR